MDRDPTLDEIEVTPAMLEAAEGMVWSADRESSYEEDYLREIYRLMEAARRREASEIGTSSP